MLMTETPSRMIYPFLCPLPACPPGSYKMSSRQQECFPCPANSVAEEEGSVVCVCDEDHFRTPLDTPSAPCTSKTAVPTVETTSPFPKSLFFAFFFDGLG